MAAFWHLLALTAPLFLLVLLGYALSHWGQWPAEASEALTRFVFSVAIPAFLFHLMADFSSLPAVDARLLIAYFGGCLVVFAVGRVIAATVFRLDGVSQSVFAMGGIFANNVLLGLPLAKVTLGDIAMPTVSLVLVFNSLLLWTLITISVEWARHRELSVRGFARTTLSVVTNPVVAGILIGTAFGFTGLRAARHGRRNGPYDWRSRHTDVAHRARHGTSEYGIRTGWRQSLAIAVLKLAVTPLSCTCSRAHWHCRRSRAWSSS